MNLSEKLKKYRADNKLTQQDFGKLLGVSKGTVINWEHGKTFPHKTMYKKMADAMGVDESYLRYDSEDAVFVSDMEEKFGSKGFQQAVALTNQLCGLFAGGELSETDKDNVMLTLQSAYVSCKTQNIKLYGPKTRRQNAKHQALRKRSRKPRLY